MMGDFKPYIDASHTHLYICIHLGRHAYVVYTCVSFCISRLKPIHIDICKSMCACSGQCYNYMHIIMHKYGELPIHDEFVRTCLQNWAMDSFNVFYLLDICIRHIIA